MAACIIRFWISILEKKEINAGTICQLTIDLRRHFLEKVTRNLF